MTDRNCTVCGTPIGPFGNLNRRFCVGCRETRALESQARSSVRRAAGLPPILRKAPTDLRFRQLAHRSVVVAIDCGLLPSLDGSIACCDCGAPAEAYDHRDYARPLDVDAVCNGCNNRRGSAKPTQVTGRFEQLVDQSQKAA